MAWNAFAELIEIRGKCWERIEPKVRGKMAPALRPAPEVEVEEDGSLWILVACHAISSSSTRVGAAAFDDHDGMPQAFGPTSVVTMESLKDKLGLSCEPEPLEVRMFSCSLARHGASIFQVEDV